MPTGPAGAERRPRQRSGGATNADADRYLLARWPRAVHPISAEGLGQLVELDSVTVARAD
ncbi:MAG: hypothetical protein R3D28_11430 [Geminicoccaceae bacterium]